MPENNTGTGGQPVEAQAQPSFYGILPADVRYDKNISPIEKLLYIEITSLCNSSGICWAGNQYFANLFGYASRTHISKLLNNLEEAGHVKIVIDKNVGNKRIITIVNPIMKNQKTYSEKSEHNKYNINKDIMSDLTDQRKSEIRKIYKLWLIHTAVDQITRLGGTKEEKKEALAAAEKSYRLTEPRKAAINRRLDDAGYEQLVRAVKAISASPFHMGDNDRKWRADLNFICRSYEKVEEWANKNKREVQ